MPHIKVYDENRVLRATFKLGEDAAAFLGFLGLNSYAMIDGICVWREGLEDFSATESYDGACEIMYNRAKGLNATA